MSTTTISADIVFRGELRYEGRLDVHGQVDGRIQSSDVLDVGQSGKIKAEIQVKQVNLKGDVDGNVKTDSLHIFSGGKLYGDIDCSQLQIDRGGMHNGVTIMSGDENKS